MAWGSREYLSGGVCQGKLRTGGNYISCLIIVIIFIGLEGEHNWGDEILKSSYGVASGRGEGVS